MMGYGAAEARQIADLESRGWIAALNAETQRYGTEVGAETQRYGTEAELYGKIYGTDIGAQLQRERMGLEERMQEAGFSSAAARQAAQLASEEQMQMRQIGATGGLERERMGLQERMQASGFSATEARQLAQIASEERIQERGLVSQETRQERSQRMALAQMLLSNARGPMGPANRRMALDILKGLGVGEGGGGGEGRPAAFTQQPTLVPPWVWDQMNPTAKQLMLDAYVSQGGEESDFMRGIEQQRPGGQTTGTASVRFAPRAV
jgi:hypothetical protein